MEIVKIVIFVPKTHADLVREALGRSGAGRIGNYDYCTFSTTGIGRWRAKKGAKPYKGEIEKLEAVEEERIETVCDKRLLPKVIKAVREVHPYEEVAIDIYPLYSLEE